jgi:hypothetical protein
MPSGGGIRRAAQMPTGKLTAQSGWRAVMFCLHCPPPPASQLAGVPSSRLEPWIAAVMIPATGTGSDTYTE